MNAWGLEKAPPREPSVMDAVQDYVGAVIREQYEAMEYLAYLARRDGFGMIVEKHKGRVVDAHVSKLVPPGTAYVMDLGILDLPVTVD